VYFWVNVPARPIAPISQNVTKLHVVALTLASRSGSYSSHRRIVCSQRSNCLEITYGQAEAADKLRTAAVADAAVAELDSGD
jgi:hypothetical protein